MATVYLTVGEVGARANQGNVMVYLGDRVKSEIVTSSAASAQATFTANRGDVARVYCETPIYITSGPSPTATATNGLFVPGGVPEFIALQAGHTVAVIDA